MPGRRLSPLVLADERHEQPATLSKSTSMPHGLVQRARIVLACGEGPANAEAARRLGVSATTVGKWRKRFLERGVQGLHDDLRPGRPRTTTTRRWPGRPTALCRRSQTAPAPGGPA